MMKPMILTTLLLSAVFAGQPASAIDRGDRMAQRWDHRGDILDKRLDRRAGQQAALGHTARANHLDRRGDHIDARFDRLGQHREARFDRRHR